MGVFSIRLLNGAFDKEADSNQDELKSITNLISPNLAPDEK
jgi:hypothetical protein